MLNVKKPVKRKKETAVLSRLKLFMLLPANTSVAPVTAEYVGVVAESRATLPTVGFSPRYRHVSRRI